MESKKLAQMFVVPVQRATKSDGGKTPGSEVLAGSLHLLRFQGQASPHEPIGPSLPSSASSMSHWRWFCIYSLAPDPLPLTRERVAVLVQQGRVWSRLWNPEDRSWILSWHVLDSQLIFDLDHQHSDQSSSCDTRRSSLPRSRPGEKSVVVQKDYVSILAAWSLWGRRSSDPLFFSPQYLPLFVLGTLGAVPWRGRGFQCFIPWPAFVSWFPVNLTLPLIRLQSAWPVFPSHRGHTLIACNLGEAVCSQPVCYISPRQANRQLILAVLHNLLFHLIVLHLGALSAHDRKYIKSVKHRQMTWHRSIHAVSHTRNTHSP